MAINTRPGTKVTAAATTDSVFPKLASEQLPANTIDMHKWNTLEGFNGDGDYIQSKSAAIAYYNAAGTQQWSKAKTDINAAVDNICGMYLDKTDALIYAVYVDTATAPDTFYTASINSAGTIVNIGNAQPTTDFSNTPSWDNGSGPGAVGASQIQRAADGSGNLFLRMSATATATVTEQEMEIDITDGSIATDTTDIGLFTSTTSGGGDIGQASYKTSDGLYIGGFKTLHNGSWVQIHDGSNKGIEIIIPIETGVFNGSPGAAVNLWKGYVTQVYGRDDINSNGYHKVNKSIFDKWVKDIAILGGMKV